MAPPNPERLAGIQRKLLGVFAVVALLFALDGPLEFRAIDLLCMASAVLSIVGLRRHREWAHWLSVTIAFTTSMDQAVFFFGGGYGVRAPWSFAVVLLPGLPFLLLVVAGINAVRARALRWPNALVAVVFLAIWISATEILGWLPLRVHPYDLISATLVTATCVAMYLLAIDKVLGLVLAIPVSAVTIHYASIWLGWFVGMEWHIDVHIVKIIASGSIAALASAFLLARCVVKLRLAMD